MRRRSREQSTKLNFPEGGEAARHEEYEPQKIGEIHQDGRPEHLLEVCLRIVRGPSERRIDQPFPSSVCAYDDDRSECTKADVEKQSVDAIEEFSVSH